MKNSMSHLATMTLHQPGRNRMVTKANSDFLIGEAKSVCVRSRHKNNTRTALFFALLLLHVQMGASSISSGPGSARIIFLGSHYYHLTTLRYGVHLLFPLILVGTAQGASSTQAPTELREAPPQHSAEHSSSATTFEKHASSPGSVAFISTSKEKTNQNQPATHSDKSSPSSSSFSSSSSSTSSSVRNVYPSFEGNVSAIFGKDSARSSRDADFSSLSGSCGDPSSESPGGGCQADAPSGPKVAASSHRGTASQQKEEYPDFFDEYWNDESSPQLKGELNRLLEYPENRHLVSSLNSPYYQITYPIQLQRHGKSQGISTRDANKITTHHVHRTSYRIKAFSHVFNVDLELNTNLLPERMRAVHRHDGKTSVDDQIEHCYYHGTVKDYSGAIAAFRTCNGLAGIIQLGNETLIVAPIAGGEKLSRPPHYVTESSKSTTYFPQKCGVTGDEWSGGVGFEHSGYSRMSHGRKRKQTRHRYVRDIQTTTKYIETALFLDKKFMELRKDNRLRAMYDALQVANIADLYLKTINTRLTITYLETWSSDNLVMLAPRQPISNSLKLFSDHVAQHHLNEPKDTSHIITGEKFDSGESGMGVMNSICTAKSAGISVDLNMYEPHLVASTMTHMIGHNLHMNHDEGRECSCLDWYGCLMSPNVVGKDHVQPSKFSKCSQDDYYKALHSNPTLNCILKQQQRNTRLRNYKPPPNSQMGYNNQMGHNSPWPINNKPSVGIRRGGYPKCGNGRVEEGEQCDCGDHVNCEEVDPCCDPQTCKLIMRAECAKGPCCDSTCKLRAKGTPCRKSASECDIPEVCDGLHGTCPIDIYKKTGTKCHGDKGYCFKGVCPTRDTQCNQIWGFGGKSSNESCYNKLNTQGVFTGNCGQHRNGSFIKCDLEHAKCGKLFCQNGMKMPSFSSHNSSYFKASYNVHGKELECKVLNYDDGGHGDDWSLTRSGTMCGKNLVCINQTCTSIYVFIEPGRCATNNNSIDCSGNGVCSNINICHCNPRWTGEDCSTALYTTPYPTQHEPTEKSSDRNIHVVGQQGSDTVFLVVVLVSGVGSVFFVFAFMALCYRSVVVHNQCCYLRDRLDLYTLT